MPAIGVDIGLNLGFVFTEQTLVDAHTAKYEPQCHKYCELGRGVASGAAARRVAHAADDEYFHGALTVADAGTPAPLPLMTDQLFTVGTDVYEFNAPLREALCSAAENTPETTTAWFDGTVLCQSVETPDGATTERIDVVDAYQMLGEDAQTELDRLDIRPVFSPPAVSTAETQLTVDVRDNL